MTRELAPLLGVSAGMQHEPVTRRHEALLTRMLAKATGRKDHLGLTKLMARYPSLDLAVLIW